MINQSVRFIIASLVAVFSFVPVVLSAAGPAGMPLETADLSPFSITVEQKLLLAELETPRATDTFISRTRDSRRDTPPDSSSESDSSFVAGSSKREVDLDDPVESETESAPEISSQLPVAVQWYMEMAEKGDREAQFNLGAVYETGFGVAIDRAKAAKWYQKAAEQDHALAQVHLGILYMLGNGVKESSIKGSKWIRAASKNGNGLATMMKETVFTWPRW